MPLLPTPLPGTSHLQRTTTDHGCAHLDLTPVRTRATAAEIAKPSATTREPVGATQRHYAETHYVCAAVVLVCYMQSSEGWQACGRRRPPGSVAVAARMRPSRGPAAALPAELLPASTHPRHPHDIGAQASCLQGTAGPSRGATRSRMSLTFMLAGIWRWVADTQ